MKRIAFIGTRELSNVPLEVVDLYVRAAKAAAHYEHLVVTGAAVGADQLAASTALQAGGLVDLKLPWRRYEMDWWGFMAREFPGRLTVEEYDPRKLPEWGDSVREFHPAPDSLTRGAFALHARNFGIVSGAHVVVAVSNPNKSGGGGTGQGLRVARSLGVRCFDLTQPYEFRNLRILLNSGVKDGDRDV